MKQQNLPYLMLAASIAVLGACSSSNDDDAQSASINQSSNPPFSTADDSITYGFASTRGPRNESATIVRVSLTDGNTIDGQYPDAQSAIAITTDGESVYQIERGNNTLTKYSASDISTIQYQISLQDNMPASGNAQSLAFLNSNIAYLTRSASDSLLIIDPTPEQLTAESLIIGKINLSAYNRGTGESLDLPDMTDAVVVNDRLFVLLQNLDGLSPSLPGYIAVIDTRTGLEIQTDRGSVPLKGIELQVVNPTSLHYSEDTGLLYVAGRGNFSDDPSVAGDAFTGGIESIDPITYQSSLIIDDGTASANNGFFMDALTITESLGYVATLTGFRADGVAINSLRTFDTLTGTVSAPVSGTEQLSITSLALGPDNHIWVGVEDGVPGFVRLDINTGAVVGERVVTSQVPDDIVFIEVQEE